MPLKRLDLATLTVTATVLLAHGVWATRDGRLPLDLGQYYTALPLRWQALQDGDWWLWARGALEPGGWYVSMLAAWLSVVGRSALAFRTLDVLWLGIVVGGSAWLVRQRAGPAAGLMAAGMVGSAPVVVGVARFSWIHLPEAAGVVVLAGVAQADPRLTRWRTAVLGALGAALLIALRPSAAVWVPTLFVLLLPALSSPQRWRLLLPITGGALGALVQAPGLPMYLLAKAEARDRYLLQVPDLLSQTMEQVGLPLLLLGAVGLWWGRRDWGRLHWMLLSWSILPLLLAAITAVGMDNFTLWTPGMLGLAAMGWARFPLTGIALTAALFLVFQSAPWLTSPSPGSRLERAYRLAGLPALSGPQNPYRPWHGYGATELDAQLTAVCPRERSCSVVADQGLVAPYVEEPGRLGLFLLGRDDVVLHWLAEETAMPDRVDALVTWSCPQDPTWRVRFPYSQTKRDQLAAAWRLSLHGSYSDWGPCVVGWYTPPAAMDEPLFEVDVEAPVEVAPLTDRKDRARPGRSRVKSRTR